MELSEQVMRERVAHAIAEGLRVGEGEVVSIFLTDAESHPFATALCAELFRRGADPHVVLVDERIDRVALREAPLANLREPSRIEQLSLQEADVHISLRGMVPLDDAEPEAAAERVAAQRRAKGLVSAMRWHETRWAVVRIPTRQWADGIGVSYATLLGEFLDGCLLDWPALRPGWEAAARRLEEADMITLVAPDTELNLRVAGRRWAVFAGEANWPDGELATAPLDDGVSGHITFPEPFVFASQRIENLRLRFERGEVVEVAADAGADVAQALIATDAGSRRVGELGIGLNPHMRTMTGDLFFDEKILGTAHIALGRAYPQCGGTNESSLHWDIVKDLRAGGDILVDGVPWRSVVNL